MGTHGFKLKPLPLDVTQEELNDLFKEFDLAGQPFIPRDSSGNHIGGHAYINFYELAEGEQTLNSFESNCFNKFFFV